jgi:uncharacterized membrane protein YtjA (UPF0391 family)
LAIAIIAELFGLYGVAGEAGWIAHVLFVVALIFLIISFVTGRGGPTVWFSSSSTQKTENPGNDYSTSAAKLA